MPVIGLDIGNLFCYTSVLFDSDPQVYDLLERRYEYGFPSTFAYTREDGEKFGNNAVHGRYAAHSRNLLKRLLQNNNESFVLDGKTFTASEALTKVIKHVIDAANQTMKSIHHETTNHVRVAYPETFDEGLVVYYKKMIESIVLEDGQHVVVDGMINEPAAAALDYLHDYNVTKEEENILCFDLGGGTCDICVVTAYPHGKLSADGQTYYSRLQRRQGALDIGGQDMTLRLADLLMGRIERMPGYQPGSVQREKVRQDAERIKLNLSETGTEVAESEMVVNGQYLPEDLIKVTREEFYDARLTVPGENEPYPGDSVRDLVARSVKEARKLYDTENPEHPISTILLVGGGSNMPLVGQMMESEFVSEVQNGLQIVSHDPSKAISHGAARYAQSVSDTIINTLRFALGERVYKDNNPVCEIHTMIDGNTALPADSGYVRFVTVSATDSVDCDIYSAINAQPDPLDVEGSYKKILNFRYQFHREVPAHTPLEIRFAVSDNGDVELYVREPGSEEEQQAHCTILNY